MVGADGDAADDDMRQGSSPTAKRRKTSTFKGWANPFFNLREWTV